METWVSKFRRQKENLLVGHQAPNGGAMRTTWQFFVLGKPRSKFEFSSNSRRYRLRERFQGSDTGTIRIALMVRRISQAERNLHDIGLLGEPVLFILWRINSQCAVVMKWNIAIVWKCGLRRDEISWSADGRRNYNRTVAILPGTKRALRWPWSLTYENGDVSNGWPSNANYKCY